LHTQRERERLGRRVFCEEDAVDLRIYSIVVVISGFDGAVGAPSWAWEKWKRAAAGMGWDPYFPGQYMLLD
jgi:hypothetical protein